MTAPLYETNLKSLKLRHRGKVRDIYDIDDKHMLIVTTDRLSAFDVVLGDPIPGKGAMLTAMSNFWFARTRKLIPNQVADIPLDQVLKDPAERAQVEKQAVVVKKLKALPIEAIVRGYLVGSGWKENCPSRFSRRPRRRRLASTTRISVSRRPPSCWAATWPRK
jgi:phosphoribosylaminoimidazole-succinocarboxamide synthase